MADLSAVQLAQIREWVGPDDGTITDDYLAALFANLGSVADVAYAVLSARRVAMLAEPLVESVNGDYSVDNRENLKAIDADLDRLRAALETAAADQSNVGTTTFGKLVRVDRDRSVTVARDWTP